MRVDGSIFDSTGIPFTGSKDIQIKAYDAASGGNLLWTSAATNASVSVGRFTINMDAASGSTPSLVTQIGLRTSGQGIYFQVEVDSGAADGFMDSAQIVLPRIRAKGTMFALNAAEADSLKGVTIAATTINYLAGVTANIAGIAPMAQALYGVTGTVLWSYLNGITGNVQTQFIDKPSLSGSHLSDARNVGLSASVAANALTVQLLTEDGETPSGSSPVYLKFRNSSLTSGTKVVRSVTSTLSVTIPSGTTLGSVTNDVQYIHIYALDNAGTVELALSIDGFKSESKLYNTTAVSGGTSPTTIYSTTARTGVALKYLGRIKASQTTAGTWAASPTEVSVTGRPSSPITDWIDAGPMPIGAVTTAPGKGTIASEIWWWRRMGSSMEILYRFEKTAGGSTGSGIYEFPLPGGYVSNSSAPTTVAGAAQVTNGGTWSIGFVQMSPPNSVMYIGLHSGSTFDWMGSSFFSLNNANIQIKFSASIPIQGWESGL